MGQRGQSGKYKNAIKVFKNKYLKRCWIMRHFFVDAFLLRAAVAAAALLLGPRLRAACHDRAAVDCRSGQFLRRRAQCAVRHLVRTTAVRIVGHHRGGSNVRALSGAVGRGQTSDHVASERRDTASRTKSCTTRSVSLPIDAAGSFCGCMVMRGFVCENKDRLAVGSILPALHTLN